VIGEVSVGDRRALAMTTKVRWCFPKSAIAPRLPCLSEFLNAFYAMHDSMSRKRTASLARQLPDATSKVKREEELTSIASVEASASRKR